MMLVNKGLALVVSADKPIYFVDTPSFSQISQGSVIGYLVPAVPIPNGVLILFALAFAASVVLNRTALGRYTFALGSKRGGTPFRRQRRRLEDRGLRAWRRHLRHCRHTYRLAAQLSPTRARPGL
jgi:hypothetical protein